LKRANGLNVFLRDDPFFRFGIRNKVVVISVGASANHAVKKISTAVGVPGLIHAKGTDGEISVDAEITKRTLINVALNPNIYGALFVGLGDERYNAHDLSQIVEEKKPSTWLHIHSLGESKAIQKGVEIVSNMLKEVSLQYRTMVNDLNGLTVGVKCGASDSTSIFANIITGYVADYIVERGGRVVFTETLELIGAERYLIGRCISRKVARKLLTHISKEAKEVYRYSPGWLGAQPNYGNIRGGITTIEEKSIGAVLKTGFRSKIIDVLDYGERIGRGDSGVYFINGPGFDVPAITAMSAAGCHLIIFTTGSGEPIGSPVSPTVKVTANPNTSNIMRDSIDLDLSRILTAEEGVEELTNKLIDFVLRVVSGDETAAEKAGHEDFAVLKKGPTL